MSPSACHGLPRPPRCAAGALACALALSVLLAGCGGGGGTADTTVASSSGAQGGTDSNAGVGTGGTGSTAGVGTGGTGSTAGVGTGGTGDTAGVGTGGTGDTAGVGTGGTGDTAGVGTGGTGDTAAASVTFAQGIIAGFGSIIVNNVHFDDSSARVLDADGTLRSSNDLRLGMSVEVDGSAVVAGATIATSKASVVRFGPDIVGRISEVSSASKTFTALGQTVLVNANTVFDSGISNGLAGLSVGQNVNVHGLYDPLSERWLAKRVELAGTLSEYRLHGPVSELDTGNQRARIAGARVGWSGLAASALPSGLADGVDVRVRLATSQSSGRWVVNSFGAARTIGDRKEAEVEGYVSGLSGTASFSVNGLKVDASGASFPDGTAALANGAKVEVKGAITGGVLVATRVKLDSEDSGGGDNSREFELSGSITAVDSSAKTFVLRGTTIGYGRSDLRYENGTAAQLTVGRKVEVKGLLSPDRTRVDATRIQIED